MWAKLLRVRWVHAVTAAVFVFGQTAPVMAAASAVPAQPLGAAMGMPVLLTQAQLSSDVAYATGLLDALAAQAGTTGTVAPREITLTLEDLEAAPARIAALMHHAAELENAGTPVVRFRLLLPEGMNQAQAEEMIGLLNTIAAAAFSADTDAAQPVQLINPEWLEYVPASIWDIFDVTTEEAIAAAEALPESDGSYLKALVDGIIRIIKAMREGLEQQVLMIGENYWPAALMTDEQRADMGLIDLGVIEEAEGNLQAARDVTYVEHRMDGGAGSSAARYVYLEKMAGQIGRPLKEGQGNERIQLGGKSMDYHFNIPISQDNETVAFVSPFEISLMRTIADARQNNYRSVVIQGLANDETIDVYNATLDMIYFFDRSKPVDQQRTYRQMIAETENVELREPDMQYTLPTVSGYDGKFTRGDAERRAPGGHAWIGFKLVSDMITTAQRLNQGDLDEAELDEIHGTMNGDGVNNRVSPAMVGYVAKENTGIAIVTADRENQDKKGGFYGVRGPSPAEGVVAQMEVADAKAAGAAQVTLFGQMGLEQDKANLPDSIADLHQPGTQNFNTNTMLFNQRMLVLLFAELLNQGVTEAELVEKITPMPMLNDKRKQAGDLQIEAAIGTVLMNLNEFVVTDQRAKAAWERIAGADAKFLRFINVPSERRSEYFTPLKTSDNFAWMAETDHYSVEVDYENETIEVVNQKPGHDPLLSTGHAYYSEQYYVRRAFRGAGVLDLDALIVTGEPVDFGGAQLIGNVEINNTRPAVVQDGEYTDVFSLGSEEALAQLQDYIVEGRLVLRDVRLDIDANGDISVKGYRSVPAGSPANMWQLLQSGRAHTLGELFETYQAQGIQTHDTMIRDIRFLRNLGLVTVDGAWTRGGDIVADSTVIINADAMPQYQAINTLLNDRSLFTNFARPAAADFEAVREAIQPLMAVDASGDILDVGGMYGERLTADEATAQLTGTNVSQIARAFVVDESGARRAIPLREIAAYRETAYAFRRQAARGDGVVITFIPGVVFEGDADLTRPAEHLDEQVLRQSVQLHLDSAIGDDRGIDAGETVSITSEIEEARRRGLLSGDTDQYWRVVESSFLELGEGRALDDFRVTKVENLLGGRARITAEVRMGAQTRSFEWIVAVYPSSEDHGLPQDASGRLVVPEYGQMVSLQPDVDYSAQPWTATPKSGTSGDRQEYTAAFHSKHVIQYTQTVADLYYERGYEGPMIVGFDARFQSDNFGMERVAATLAANGIEVIFVDEQTPTPVMAYLVNKLGAAGYIHLTASHNPPGWLGMKMAPSHGGPSPKDIVDELNARAGVTRSYAHGTAREGRANGSIRTLVGDMGQQPIAMYREWLFGQFPGAVADIRAYAVENPEWRMGADAMHGTTAGAFQEVFGPNGLNILQGGEVLRSGYNPNFAEVRVHIDEMPVRPEPDAKYLRPLIDFLDTAREALGISRIFGAAGDNDGDRIGLIDQGGEFITANQFASILLYFLAEVEGEEGAIFKTMATTNLLNAIADKHPNVKAIYEGAVGFKNAVPYYMDPNINMLVAAEESAHIGAMNLMSWDDSIAMAFFAAWIQAKTDKSLAQLLEDAEAYVGRHFDYDRTNVALDDVLAPALRSDIQSLHAALGQGVIDDRETFMTHPLAQEVERVAKLALGDAVELVSVVTLDGMKFVLSDGSWIAIRASGTENVMRLYVESTSEIAVRPGAAGYEAARDAAYADAQAKRDVLAMIAKVLRNLATEEELLALVEGQSETVDSVRLDPMPAIIEQLRIETGMPDDSMPDFSIDPGLAVLERNIGAQFAAARAA